jgi:hypothetical protein
MIIWILILLLIALSLFSGEFSGVSIEFIENHVCAILLLALAMLYTIWKSRDN